MKLMLNQEWYKSQKTFKFTGIGDTQIEVPIKVIDNVAVIDVDEKNAKKLLSIAIINEYKSKKKSDDMKKVVKENDDMKKVVKENDENLKMEKTEKVKKNYSKKSKK